MMASEEKIKKEKEEEKNKKVDEERGKKEPDKDLESGDNPDERKRMTK